MEMSSSSSSQWRPRLLIVTCSRYAGVPCSRRGNHASGTPRVRPSDNSTHMLSWSKRTLLAFAEELIPHPRNSVPPSLDDFGQLPEDPRTEAIVIGRLDSGQSQNSPSIPSRSA